MYISCSNFFQFNNSSFFANNFRSQSFLNKKIIAIAGVAFILIAICYCMTYYFNFNIFNPFTNTNPHWINAHPDFPLTALGLGDDYDKILNFVKKNGHQLKCLNLGRLPINDDQFKELIKWTPYIHYLSVQSSEITNNALISLNEIQLTSIHLTLCNQLTNDALIHLKDMPLSNVNFNGCKGISDQALADLRRKNLLDILTDSPNMSGNEIASSLIQNMPKNTFSSVAVRDVRYQFNNHEKDAIVISLRASNNDIYATLSFIRNFIFGHKFDVFDAILMNNTMVCRDDTQSGQTIEEEIKWVCKENKRIYIYISKDLLDSAIEIQGKNYLKIYIS